MVAVRIDDVSNDAAIWQPGEEDEIGADHLRLSIFFIGHAKRVLTCTCRVPVPSDVSLPLQLCEQNLVFPESFNSWEDKVLLAELQREGNVAWYRNPARASQDSLGVTYEEDGKTKMVRPDFIFFARLPDGSIVADIVDPHGYHLADALPKLKGLARYAEINAEHFRRIEAVTAIGNGYKVLDLSEPAVRAAIRDATNAKTL